MIIKHYQEQRLLHKHIYADTSHVFWCCSFQHMFCRNMRPFFWTRRSLTFLYCPVIYFILARIWKMPPDAENAMSIPSVIYGEENVNDVQCDHLTLWLNWSSEIVQRVMLSVSKCPHVALYHMYRRMNELHPKLSQISKWAWGFSTDPRFS